ncbi:ABC transporter permease [Pendulispora rubella]|uniref:ABC transporter permease n=1 Tax=Pendulispora rubella TaxID=2741070 RepID=A0ABZ2L4S4_9BACT
MISLARATLVHEWRRFVPAVFAVAFSGLLVLVQIALLMGAFANVTVYIDQSRADLWVGFRDTPSVDQARNIPERTLTALWMHPEVVRVEAFNWGGGDFRRPDGAPVSGYLVGVDTRADALTFGKLLTAEQRRLLDEPDGIVIDEADQEKLGVEIGDHAELNGRHVKVVGTVRGIRAAGGANIVSSLATARRVDPSLLHTEDVAYYLVKLRDPKRAEAVRDALQPSGTFRPFTVWTAEQFSWQSQLYWVMESGSGSGFAFSSVLGAVVGAVITSQTLMAAIVASLREYATLRALGVSLGALRRVVLEQSLWVGLIGLTITLLTTFGLQMAADRMAVTMLVPLPGVAGTSLLVLAIAACSGLLAVRQLARAEPASLLR